MLGPVFQRGREIPDCFSGDVLDTPPASSRATVDTDAFDPTQEYCTRDIVFFWQHPSCFSQRTPSPFTIECVSYSCGEIFFAAEKSRLFGDHQTLQHIIRVSDPRLYKKHGREVRNFDLAVWGRERENFVLVISYEKVAQTPATRTGLLDTGDTLLAKGNPYDLIWGIRYRADGIPDRYPPLLARLNFAGRGFENRATYFPRPRADADAPQPW